MGTVLQVEFSPSLLTDPEAVLKRNGYEVISVLGSTNVRHLEVSDSAVGVFVIRLGAPRLKLEGLTHLRYARRGGRRRSANAFGDIGPHENPDDDALRTPSRRAEASGGRKARKIPCRRIGECGGKKYGGRYKFHYIRELTMETISRNSSKNMAGPTRLELATSCVTGRRSNQLNYGPVNRELPDGGRSPT